MKVFDNEHYKGRYVEHLKRSAFISALFLGAGLLGMVHAVTRFFLPEILTEANKRIAKELEQRMCECD